MDAFNYLTAKKQSKLKDKEIKRLKMLIKKLYYDEFPEEDKKRYRKEIKANWEKFKTKNKV